MIYKFSANEISISTANTVWNNPIIRVINPMNQGSVATIANSSANIASFSVRGDTEIIIVKTNTDTIQGSGLVASPVAYTH